MNATSSRSITASILMLATLLASWPAQADVPSFVTYSGRLTDGTAWGESTQADLTFWLCTEPEGDVADCLWTETVGEVQLEDGYFAVTLGQTSPLPAPLPAAAWLAVAVDNGEPLAPRQQVGSVPYAIQAGNAGALEQQTLTDLDGRYVLTDSDGQEMSGPLSLPADGLTVGGTQLVAANGNVGIGTAEPDARLEVETVDSDARVHFDSANSLWLDLDRGTAGGAGRVRFQTDGESNFEFGLIGGVPGFHITDDALNKLTTVLPDGNVGIGTEEPVKKLEVAGTIYANNALDSIAYYMQGTQWGGVIYPLGVMNSWALGYLGNYPSTINPVLAWNGDGNVGIGTTSPAARLEVEGVGWSPAALRVTGTDSVGSFIEFNALQGKKYAIGSTGPSAGLFGADYFAILDSTVSEYRMVIDTSGNVGIGTTSPGAKLEVNGRVGIRQSSSASDTPYGMLHMKQNVDNAGLVVEDDNTDRFLQLSIFGDDVYLAANHFGAGNGYPTGIKFRTRNAAGSLVDAMYLDKDGNLGIGVSDPGSRLTVLGSNGGIGVKTVDDNHLAVRINADGTQGGIRLYDQGVATTKIMGGGDSYFDSGNVGIGTSSPAGSKLHVSSDEQEGVVINAKAGSPASPTRGLLVYNENNNTDDSIASFSDGVLWIMDVKRNGNVGIGTNVPEYKLHVNGSLYATSCAGCASDERLKEAIEPIRNALAKVLAITGVTFEFDQESHPDMNLPKGRQMGLIAQEVEQVAPELVMSPEGDGFKAIKYGNAIALVIEAMKEQQALIGGQQDEIERLRSENGDMRAKLVRMEKRLVALEKR